MDVESIECKINCDLEGIEFAFYLNIDGENVEQQWYGNQSYAIFDLDYDRTKLHTVVFFVKDHAGEIHTKRTNLNQLEIDFIPSFNISKNKLNCNIKTSQENVEFAFYLYLNTEKVRQKWYSEKNQVEFQIDKTPIEKFEIKYFIRDGESNIYSRSMIYDKIEPEENPIKSKNQYNFFVSTDKKIIYKSINSSNHDFSKLLEKTGKIERFTKILNGTLFSSRINNHIVKGFDLESNGSYKSNFIKGYRLDLLCLLTSKYPSFNLPSKLEMNKVIQQSNILLEALQNEDEKGELCGDWALHNLIYSISDDKIYNIDLEGFITYYPLPEWANLEKITLWIDKLKHIYSND